MKSMLMSICVSATVFMLVSFPPQVSCWDNSEEPNPDNGIPVVAGAALQQPKLTIGELRAALIEAAARGDRDKLMAPLFAKKRSFIDWLKSSQTTGKRQQPSLRYQQCYFNPVSCL